MSDRFAELEYKFDADAAGLEVGEFNATCMFWRPESYTSTSGPDVYYSHGKNAARHRWSGGAGELTVKQRKGRNQIVDRLEVDLRFAKDMALTDVQAFLDATGFKRTLTLMKDHCHVFWFKDSGADVVVSYYGVSKLENSRHVGLRHFVEAEVEKGSTVSDVAARTILESWARRVKVAFGLTKPINLSLYELYTGKKYPTAKKGK